MAIGTITMILANVGLQIYNNWCGSRQNCELQQKREEFERAARERNTEHMWKLLREGQALALQLEAEKHNDRLNELKVEIDNLLQKLTYETAIINWPLKVLPIVMKNQAFGNILAKQEENIAMHIIFTRSNYDKFNKSVFPVIEKELELYCDNCWSTVSKHPLLFYSGAWIPQSCPTDVQVDSMRTALNNLPTIIIAPFFRPNDGRLVFQIHIWGVGASSTDRFDVQEIVPNDFQRTFTNQDDYFNKDGLMEEIIEDVIPYLECLIGYIADTYFWSSSGLTPQLPSLVTNGTINTNGMKYLVSDCREYYDRLLLTGEEKAKENPFAQDNLLNLYEGCAELWDKESKDLFFEKIFVDYCSRKMACDFSSIEDAFNNFVFSTADITFIDSYISLCQNKKYVNKLKEIKESLNIDTTTYEADNSLSLLNEVNVSYLMTLANQGNPIACYRLGEIYEYSIGVEYSPEESDNYYAQSVNLGYTLAIIRNKIINENVCGISKSDIEYLENNESIQSTLFKAICMYKGYGIEKSVEDAMNELEKLSESNHPYVYYLSAQIVKEQYNEEQGELLVELLLKSANIGYVQAQLDLMNIYNEGKYVKENPQLCVEFAKKAALQGHPEALLTLAICSMRGYGMKINKTKAKELLKMAAERGNEDAIEILNSIFK